MINNKFLFWLIIAFATATIGDIISTLFILKAEMNPLYVYFGNAGLVIAIILKILIVGIFTYIYKSNKYSSNFMYYIVILVLVYGTLLTSIAVIGNVQSAVDPSLIEGVENIPKAEMVASYTKVVSILYFIPVLLSLFVFFIYDKSLKYVNIGK